MIIILGIIVAVVFLYIIIVFNTFIRLKNRIKHSKSSIDIYLTQRFDLIPNLVSVVKEYTRYEESVYTNLAKLRSQYNVTKSLVKGKELNTEFNKLLAVGENNPNLKASEQFLSLQKSLIKMESQLQAARRVYNGDVTLYNTTISTFPNSILASAFGFQTEELFEIEEYKRENVNVNL